MPHRRHSIVNFRIYRNEIGDGTLQYTADIASSVNGQHLSAKITSIAGGNAKSKSLSCDGGQPWHAQFCRILQREQSGSVLLTELCTTGDMFPLSMAGLATTTSATQRLTQPYQTTTIPWELHVAIKSEIARFALRVKGLFSAGDGSPT